MRYLSLLILLCIPTSLFAQERVGFLDVLKSRLALNAIARYDLAYAGDKADPTLDPGKEFAGGLAATLLLGPSLALNFGSVAGVDTKQIRSWVQLDYPFFGAQRQPIKPLVAAPNY